MTTPALTVLSLGAGVQSTTIALLAVQGLLPRPDVAIFADAGWEPATVYTHLDRLAPVLAHAGIELRRVSAGDLRADALDPAHRFASVPYTQRQPGPCRRCHASGSRAGETCVRCRGSGWDDGRGIARRQCTGEYKTKPIKAEVRRIPGYPHPSGVPAGVHAEQWIGFSTDEIGRRNDHRSWPRYQRPAYPLIDHLPMTRRDCQRWLTSRGWTVTRSACIGWPFHGNRTWRELRDHRPKEWAQAVAFDHAIRHGGARAPRWRAPPTSTPTAYPSTKHPSTALAGGSGPTAKGDLLDPPVDHEDDHPDGCSPYGCRSGNAA